MKLLVLEHTLIVSVDSAIIEVLKRWNLNAGMLRAGAHDRTLVIDIVIIITTIKV